MIDIGQSQSCNIDVACVRPSAALTDAAKAVAQLLFIGDTAGNEYLCTGTLLNDLPSTNTPYLFTAAHCMTSASAAHTLNTLWFFDAIACKDNTVPPFVQLTAGATLLGRSQDHDWALVRLNERPPAGAHFAAWNAEPVTVGTAATTLHHPLGDLKKYARGYVGQSVFLADSTVHGSFYEVPYLLGITEGGSSGSALLTFLDEGGYFEVRGGIAEGNLVSCPAAPGAIYDDYSRVEDMLPLVRQYLTPTAPNPAGKVAAVEYYNHRLDHYFVSATPAEIDALDLGTPSGWERTGLRFLAYVKHAPGTHPVCRFYRRLPWATRTFIRRAPTNARRRPRNTRTTGSSRVRACSTSGCRMEKARVRPTHSRCGASSTRRRSITATRRKSCCAIRCAPGRPCGWPKVTVPGRPSCAPRCDSAHARGGQSASASRRCSP